ncbi:glycosyltransferase [Pseudooceanicola sp. LIPI14-2-Ac024]|uniref:glycosyltransferase n=1 Tax=Pseudooceanicola sp. LIPI14-2-Ac024 TaxID=3344875 RepID=UPI0035CFD2B1
MAASDTSGRSDLLDTWRRRGGALIAARRAEHDGLLDTVEALIARRQYGEAAAAAQVAATYPVLWHTGQFVSPRLEAAIRDIAVAALPNRQDSASGRPGTTGLRVLHVATELYGIGGHARMVARWVRSDPENEHSLALTAQHRPVPDDACAAVAASGGWVTQLNAQPGDLLRRARRLQRLILAADLVVLHIHNQDIVPLLALGGMTDRPPALLLNHCDHQFWAGAAFADLVVCTRRSGQQLCLDRRGLAPDRVALMPLCLAPDSAVGNRATAKQALGLPADAVVVVTIARAVKFRDIGGDTFVDTLLPALRADPNLHLVVVGPGAVPAWQAGVDSLPPGRVRLVAETPETGRYLDAADIYLDSFPFVSITSLFEAGLHGLPLVTRGAFGADCRVMEADSPGLDGVLVRTQSPEALCETLLDLAADWAAREDLGNRTRNEIMGTNVEANWRRALHAVYRAARQVPRQTGALVPAGTISDLDRFIPFVFDDQTCEDTALARRAWATELGLKTTPYGWRLRKIAWLVRENRLHGSAFRPLIPGWISVQVRSRLGYALR